MPAIKTVRTITEHKALDFDAAGGRTFGAIVDEAIYYAVDNGHVLQDVTILFDEGDWETVKNKVPYVQTKKSKVA